MGESGKQPFQLSFNRFLRVAFQGSRVTSIRGLILVRELDERLGLGELIAQQFKKEILFEILTAPIRSRSGASERVVARERIHGAEKSRSQFNVRQNWVESPAKVL